MQKEFKLHKVLPGRSSAPCIVVNPDAEFYDAFGNIYHCYEFPYIPKYEKPAYKIGHLDKDENTYNPKSIIRAWFENIQIHIFDCPKCHLYFRMQRGFPILQIQYRKPSGLGLSDEQEVLYKSIYKIQKKLIIN
ncbi:MAG: hypothetical protein ACMUEM_00110 [Flavobacteriales bacterium AspAUS03]